jgi:hypothetical protein
MNYLDNSVLWWGIYECGNISCCKSHPRESVNERLRVCVAKLGPVSNKKVSCLLMCGKKEQEEEARE